MNQPIANLNGQRAPGVERFRTILVSSLAIAFVLTCGIIFTASPKWNTFELGALQSLSDGHTPFLNAVALSAAWLFDPPRAIVIVAALSVAIAFTTRSLRITLVFISLVVIPWAGCELMKWIVHRPRPSASLLSHPLSGTPASFSYPSGHTTIVAVLGLALIVIIRRRKWRAVAVVATIVVTLVVAWSRVYLGVHYITDVSAAIIYSVAAVSLVLALLWRVGFRQSLSAGYNTQPIQRI